jgi:hypothetical protein
LWDVSKDIWVLHVGPTPIKQKVIRAGVWSERPRPRACETD